eukprot:g301.t1
MYVPTMRNDPAEATAASHRLLQRAGFIRPGASGTFLVLPLAMRVIDKIVRLIDYEMSAVGAQKLSMPVLHSAELWKKTGRWESAGSELWRLQDRKGSDFCLAPTHEELFTELIADTVQTAADLPIALYQIGPKYRDEARPRYGLLRGREFLMKDAYSFHATEEDAVSYYREMEKAYVRLFKKLKRPFIRVEADGGAIGGSLTHEFQMLADVGEDVVLSCPNCGYAANEERAQGTVGSDVVVSAETSGDDVAMHAILVDSVPVGTLVCAKDRRPNPILLHDTIRREVRVEGGVTVEQILVDDSVSFLNSLNADAPLYIDATCDARFVTETATNACVVSPRGFFTFAEEGDTCGRCESDALVARRSIEVGQIFYLGDKYSTTLGATTKTADGVDLPMQMGCYGLGVSRILAALVEASTFSSSDGDDAAAAVGSNRKKRDRVRWPAVVCPYVVSIVTAGGKSKDTFRDVATDMALRAAEADVSLHGEVVLDDRWSAGLGTKLTESELIGYPFTVIVGRGYEERGAVEIRDAVNDVIVELPPADAVEYISLEYAKALGSDGE